MRLNNMTQNELLKEALNYEANTLTTIILNLKEIREKHEGAIPLF